MSVNITVNGRYIKSCTKHHLLSDPERYRKEDENERRKLRIQQVRAASKNIASKVRNDVEIEKQRQLRKIEEIKAQEMEMWRQNMLTQHETNLKSAIFQVGTAHRAAKAEAAMQAQAHKKKQKTSLKRQRKYMAKNGKENVLKNVDVQTDITGKCYPQTSASIFSASQKQTVDDSETYSDEDNTTSVSTESYADDSQNSSSSLSDSLGIVKNRLNFDRKLESTAPVLIEVPITRLSATKHSVVQSTQTPSLKAPYKKESKIRGKSTEFASATEEMIKTSPGGTVTKKRFTQISDIIRQQKSSEDAEQPPIENLDQHRPSIAQKSPIPPKSKSPMVPIPQSGISYLHESPSKSRSRSLTTTRAISTQTASSQATKSVVSTQSQRSSSGRVQFYDYNNKFEKCYDHPPSVVEVEEAPICGKQMNAMEQAELAATLRKAREEEMEKLRKKSAERCQRAIEREQVRRACEDLTVKLDALAKQRPAIPDDNRQFSSLRLNQVAAEKETKLNNAVESILNRPAIITCPSVSRQQPEPIALKPEIPKRRELNVGSVLNDINSLNSSDSCTSILLGYVNGQSKQVADDIKNINNESGETNKEKAERLQNLLTRINQLRESLMNELERYSSSASPDIEHVQSMVDSISEFRKERENILVQDSSKGSISKRESDLKRKEEILGSKLKKFHKIQPTANKDSVTTTEEGSQDAYGRRKSKASLSVNKRVSKDESGDMDIYRKDKLPLNRDTAKKKDDLGTNGELSSEEELERFIDQQKFLLGEKPVEIVIKIRGDNKQKKAKKLPTKSPRKLSTLIQSPAVKKKRKKATSTVLSNESSSTSYRSLPIEIHNKIEKVLVKEPSLVPKSHISQQCKDKSSKFKKPSSTLNPLMAHYVQRLLGMSRNSINALGVNSSEVDTPSSSIINTTANLSAAETEKLASNRLETVQKFIEDNYSFINELEESLRQSNSTDSSIRVIENVWKKSLKEQQLKTLEKNPPTKDKDTKSTNQTVKKTVNKQGIIHYKEKMKHADKCTQLTDSCTQRIAELSEMITKIRREKQKILETTLSTVSENYRNSTEYLDLPDQRNSSEESITRTETKSSEQVPTQSFGTEPQLEKNKITGISRDSGISISRPITAQETRESTVEELHQGQSSTESLADQFKKTKPPISIARYSPVLVEDVPHELSTIFEVDTPATSRVNTSIHNNNGQNFDASPQFQDEQVKVSYRKFPTFEEYARINHLDITQLDPEFSMQFEKEYNEFIHLAREDKIADYEEFSTFRKYVLKSPVSDEKEAATKLFASLKMANMSFKKFPTRKEYLDKIGVSTADFLDSQSLDNVEESGKQVSNSSSESIMNIESELKLRKILTKSFRQTTRLPDSAKAAKTDSHVGDMSGIKQIADVIPSNDEQSDNLESDLMRMGINWPSVMKKKTKETQALSSTSSSAGQHMSGTKKITPKVRKTIETSYRKKTYAAYETTQTEDGGRQLNLREFLTKELLKRTTTSSSLSLSEDSVASSILRSIIGSMTPSPQPQDNGAGTGLERQKTSTPMASNSGSSEREDIRSRASVQLFSGESLLSSVHFNNSSRDLNKDKEKDFAPH